MWYGVLGGKEILQKTFKNLDQRVQLECDGQRIPLPSLQGIVIMNIPRWVYMLKYGTAHSLIFIPAPTNLIGGITGLIKQNL